MFRKKKYSWRNEDGLGIKLLIDGDDNTVTFIGDDGQKFSVNPIYNVDLKTSLNEHNIEDSRIYRVNIEFEVNEIEFV